jgi:hypothetical protein
MDSQLNKCTLQFKDGVNDKYFKDNPRKGYLNHPFRKVLSCLGSLYFLKCDEPLHKNTYTYMHVN